MSRYEYLVVLALCVAVTMPLELLLGVRVYRQAKRLLAALACTAAVFVSWDLLGAWLGHWDYNPAYVTGLRLLGLPIEEYLFFAVIPLCAIMAYEAVRLTLDDVSRWLSGSFRHRAQKPRSR